MSNQELGGGDFIFFFPPPPGRSALLDTPRGLRLLIGRQHLRGLRWQRHKLGLLIGGRP